MAKEPLGIAAYNGLAVPVTGESEIRQVDSSRTVLTFTHSTANSGRFVTWRDYAVPNSTLAGVDVAAVDADGGFQALSGSTVAFELNSSGLFGSGGQLLVSGANTKPAISPTTGANYQITSTQSGTLFFIGDNNGTSQLLLLPANPTAGFWFEVYVPSQTAVDGLQINSTADSSAKIYLPGLSSAFSTADAIQPLSVLAHAIRLTAQSSVIWWADPIGQFQFGESTVDAAQADYGWSTATTA